MTTASAPSDVSDAPQPEQENAITSWLGRHQFLLRRLHSLSGIIFGGYVVLHLLVNATLVEGVRHGGVGGGESSIYQLQVDKIWALPFLTAITWIVLLIPIIYHTLYGIIIIAGGRPNVGDYGYGKNWNYLLQRISAIYLIFFIAFHYLAMKGAFGGEWGAMLTFVPTDATQSAVNHFHAGWWIGWIVYPLGILAATFHLANGFWTAGITWGLTISARAQRLWMYVCILLFLFTFICGMTALGSALAGDPTDGPTPAQQGIDSRVGEKGSNLAPVMRPMD